MKVEQWPVSRPKPYEKNPRRNRAAVATVANSIERYGWRQPIVVDQDGIIIIGHTRLAAAKRLKLKEVPVHVAEGLSDDEVKALRLMDNRSAENASWDEDLLVGELNDLLQGEFDLVMTGFSGEELSGLLATTDGRENEDKIPKKVKKRVKAGDLWQLGIHRLKCGDATLETDVKHVLGDIQPHLMVTDPPYGVAYDANWRNEADRANGRPIGAMATLRVTNDQNADWREAWQLFPGDVAYVWHAGNKGHIVAESLIASGFEIRSQIIWAKNNIVIGRGHYHPKHEPCWYVVRGKAQWSGSRKQSTVWNIDKPMKSETGHSTQKPVECMRRPILNNSSPGQAVYDPFLGSGTTLIAAETEQRQCLGLELEPKYCDIILQRWEDLTGQKAELLDRKKATRKKAKRKAKKKAA